jgi:hypothetical protein
MGVRGEDYLETGGLFLGYFFEFICLIMFSLMLNRYPEWYRIIGIHIFKSANKGKSELELLSLGSWTCSTNDHINFKS